MASRIALVTGAASGIGEACVNVLTAEGYTVIGVDIKQPLKTTVASDFYLVNLADPDAITKLAATASTKYDKLHILVNNAGVYQEKKIEETQVEDWNRILNINARAPFLLVKNFLPLLRSAQGASVVNVASVHSRATYKLVHPYAASKGALVGVTRSLAIELAPDKIRVNAVNPGCIRTPMLTGAFNDEQLDEMGTKIPAGVVGDPTEIANVIAFLGSPKASYLTGEMVTVDGGLLSKLPM